MTTKDYLDEYAGAYRAVDNCSDSLGGVEDCHICKEDKERMQEIIQELEASIRKDTVAQMRTLDVVTSPEKGVLEQKIRKEVLEDIIQKERMRSLDFIDDLLYWEENKGIDIK